MTSEAIITFSLAVLALGLKPGPGMMMVMSRTIAQGMSACYAFLAGFLLVTLLYLILVFIGFQYVNLDLVFISILVKALAATYLIWIGVKGFQNIELSYSVEDCKTERFIDGFFGAMVLTASNPLVIVFYAGILPSLLDVSTMTLDDMILITSIVLVIEGGLVLAYCLPLSLFRKRFPVDFLKGLRVFCSIMMIIIGLYIGYMAVVAEDLRTVF